MEKETDRKDGFPEGSSLLSPHLNLTAGDQAKLALESGPALSRLVVDSEGDSAEPAFCGQPQGQGSKVEGAGP